MENLIFGKTFEEIRMMQQIIPTQGIFNQVSEEEKKQIAVDRIRRKKLAFQYLKDYGIERMIIEKKFGFIDVLELNEEAAMVEERMMEEGKIQERNLACFL